MASNSKEDQSNSELDPYDTDESDEYVPENGRTTTSDDSDQSDSNRDNETEYVTPNITRKRRRCMDAWKRNVSIIHIGTTVVKFPNQTNKSYSTNSI
ncbi:hypothetical protein FQR65_LT14842 [Abscondita terminalis]|nr:hypothetical protein FQR65_LT14842 [Abscondita terminalis]